MRDKEIPKIKDIILETLGDDCEKIILFGFYAYLLLSVINISVQTVDIVAGIA